MAAPQQDSHGRLARRPASIPLRGWRDILKRVFGAVTGDQLPLTAAGIAFFLMLALVPSIIALLTVYALVADPAQVRSQLSPLLGVLPGQAGDLVVRQLHAATQIDTGGLTFGLVASLVAVLWSTSNAVRWLIAGLNMAYGEQETRGFLRLRGLALVFTLGTLVVVATALGVVAAVPVVLDVVGADNATRLTVNVLRWVGGVALVVVALAALYRFGPDRDDARWRWITWGIAVAVLLWLGGSVGFSLYLTYFSNYHETYGTLAGVAVLLLWLYLSSFAVLLGAEIDAEIEHQTAVDTTTGEAEPMGQRGAHVADTLGRTTDDPGPRVQPSG